MRFLPNVPWHAVPLGTVVLDPAGVPRTVTGTAPYDIRRTLILLEGDHRPHVYTSTALVTPVELDGSDAVAALLAADITVTPIKES